MASEASASEQILFDAESYPFLYNAQYFIGADELSNTKTPPSEQLKLYPNPVKDVSKITLQGLTEDARFTLYNTKGKVVLQEYISIEQAEISIGKLPAGQYFYAVHGDTKFYRGKLTIQ